MASKRQRQFSAENQTCWLCLKSPNSRRAQYLLEQARSFSMVCMPSEIGPCLDLSFHFQPHSTTHRPSRRWVSFSGLILQGLLSWGQHSPSPRPFPLSPEHRRDLSLPINSLRYNYVFTRRPPYEFLLPGPFSFLAPSLKMDARSLTISPCFPHLLS